MNIVRGIMNIVRDKYNDLSFPPSFEGGKVYFYRIANSHLAQAGEDWEFVVLKEYFLNKTDKKGQPMYIREVSLVRRNERLFTSSHKNFYELVSGERVIETGSLLDLFNASKADWDNAYIYPNSVQVECKYGTHNFFVSLSMLKDKERELIPPEIIKKINEKKSDAEQARKESVDKLLSIYSEYKKVVKDYKDKYPMTTFNPTLDFRYKKVNVVGIGDRFRLEIYYNRENVMIYPQADYEIVNLLSESNVNYRNLSFKNFSENINLEGKWFEEWLEKHISIPEPEVFDFLPKYKGWQEIPDNFWDIYNLNYDRDYDWEGNDLIKVKVGSYEIDIPCKRMVYKTNVDARLWYSDYDLSIVENKTTKKIINSKLVMNQFIFKRLEEYTVEVIDWYPGAGAEAKSIVDALRLRGFDAYYEMINTADNGLYDEDGNCYAVSPRHRKEIKVKIKIKNNIKEEI